MRNLKLLSICFLLFMSFLACAQKTVVPKVVTTAFSEKFPDVKTTSWEKESETEWEAEFKINGIKYSANFDTNGIWLETEHHIQTSEIPTTVNNTLKSSFPNYKIDESEISETALGIFFEFELENEEDAEIEVTIDVNGNIIQKVSEDEDEN